MRALVHSIPTKGRNSKKAAYAISTDPAHTPPGGNRNTIEGGSHGENPSAQACRGG